MKFKNSYVGLPESFYSYSRPANFTNPELIGFNYELANSLGFDWKKYTDKELAEYFSGQKIFNGSLLISMAYAGHQFGHFVPTLGDGRAMLLGEVIDSNQKRFDIQLKGQGPTAFSRKGDGKSGLGPVIREFIVSEAMFRLGVPTTRALAAVRTGDFVQREKSIPGGVFTRVASSHLRIGTFEYFASRKDYKGLKTLLDYSIHRHYPDQTNALLFFEAVATNLVRLVSKWMGLGFIHGVMNTDNMSIAGETIDFGPCAFMDHFNYNQVYSFIDRNGRYAYANQPNIILWNLSRLADCLIPLISEDENNSMTQLNDVLSRTQNLMREEFYVQMGKKLGLSRELSIRSIDLISNWLEYLNAEKIDFTLGFRKLSELAGGLKNTDDDFYPETSLFFSFLKRWQKIVSHNTSEIMNSINPLYIPRNHWIERAIESSIEGDYSIFHDMNQVLLKPFTNQDGFERFTLPPKEEEKIKNTFCGT